MAQRVVQSARRVAGAMSPHPRWQGRRHLRCLTFTSRDVFANLAAEEHFYSQLYKAPEEARESVLMFWRNRPCVVVGISQNHYLECNLPAMAARHIPLARRKSGGGAVYHDEGNLNLTFLTPKPAYEPGRNANILAQALQDGLGVPARVMEERNDIVVDGHKISGSAYRIGRLAAYHHCTLLVSSNLGNLKNVLRSELAPYIVSKGVPSVRSPVCSLDTDIEAEAFQSVLQLVAENFHRALGEETLSFETMDAFELCRQYPDVEKLRREFQSPEWIDGRSPIFTFSRTFLVGDPQQPIKVEMNARRGEALELKLTIGATTHDVAAPVPLRKTELTAALTDTLAQAGWPHPPAATAAHLVVGMPTHQ